jgi:hypothetical protein
MNYNKKVISVSRINIELLASMVRIDNNRVSIDNSPEWEKLKIEIPGDLVLSSKIENKQTIYTAKLTFQYCGDSYSTGKFAYKVSLANGKKIIIGSGERPYPVVETSEDLSSGNSNSQLLSIVINYSSAQEIAFI